MHVTNINGVKVYNLSAGKSIPEWLSNKQKKSLIRKDEELERRITLIQDFEMPAVTNSVCMTPDENYILISGMYKPRIRCYDTQQLSMKFERCVDSEIIKILPLSEDYSKFICLEHDRWIEFHASYGFHYKTRIPRLGHDIDYDKVSCDLYIVANGGDIFRLNLAQGRFLAPFESNSRVLTACDINPHHRFLTCVSADGTIECWDPRARNRVAQITADFGSFQKQISSSHPLSGISAHFRKSNKPGFSAITYKDELRFGVGTNFGTVQLYDLRSRAPYHTKDHMYGLPIGKIQFLQNDWIASMDPKCIKIWAPFDRNDIPRNFEHFEKFNQDFDLTEMNQSLEYGASKNLTTIEPVNADCLFNDFCVVTPDTGMLLVAQEEPQMGAYFIPTLGPAPKWFAYLDTLTEELQGEVYYNKTSADLDSQENKDISEINIAKSEQTNNIYDDYTFCTISELENLGLSHLIGTKALRAYMHGYFISNGLYYETRAKISDPTLIGTTIESFKQAKIQAAIEERLVRTERLKINEKKITVNKELAEKLSGLMQQQEKEIGTEEMIKSPGLESRALGNNTKQQIKKEKALNHNITSLITDERFGQLFHDPAFTIDKSTEEYKFLDPLVSKLERKLKQEKRVNQEQTTYPKNLTNDNMEYGNKEIPSSSDDESYFFPSTTRAKNTPSHEQTFEENTPSQQFITAADLRTNKKTPAENVNKTTNISNIDNRSNPNNYAINALKPINVKTLDLQTRIQQLKKAENMPKHSSIATNQHHRKSNKAAIIDKTSKDEQPIHTKREIRSRRIVKDKTPQHNGKFRRKRL